MAKQSTRVEVNNFVGGFVTEASPLNTPANATTDEQNFVLRRNGTRDRRLGIDVETAASFQGRTVFFDEDDIAPSTFVWKSPGGDNTKEFLVLNTFSSVYIYDLAGEVISKDYLFTFLPIDYSSGVASFTSVDGKLVMAYGASTIAVVTYNAVEDIFSLSYGSIRTRDVWGLPEEQEVKVRPTSLTPYHEYNLNNQSWGVTRRDDSVVGRPFSYSLQVFKNYFNLYPSNTDVVWTGLNFRSGDFPVEAMVPSLYSDRMDVFSRAARGYFIIDALKRGVSRYQAFTTNPLSSTDPTAFFGINTITALYNALVDDDITEGGATVTTSFAGRVFFGGFSGKVINPINTSPDLSSYIFFSQLVKNERDVFNCYQEGDPTSREGSDIVDTDGGFVRISGLANLVGLVALNSSLIVLGSNGVWEIKGGNEIGFSASNYSVRKVSNFGCLSSGSIVSEGNAVFFWSDSGILVLSPDQFNTLQINNITQTTIQTFYENISPESKQSSKGVYDPQTRKVRWIFDFDLDFSIANQTKELIFDLTLNAFSKNVFGSDTVDNPRVVGVFNTPPFRSGITVDDVIVEGVPVEVSAEQITITSTVRQSGLESVKYVVYYVEEAGPAIRRGFASITNQQFKDWPLIRTNGVDAKAFMVTGAVTAGDSMIHKQVPYLVMHFRRTEEGMELDDGDLVPVKQSSCLIRSQWDWATSANSNKWSPLFQAYRQNRAYMPSGGTDPFDTGFETVVSKNKLRGRGRAFSLYMETEPEKDCRILGWNLSINGNSVA